MTTAQLPNDIDALKSLIIEQHERLHAQHDQMYAERDQLKEKIAELEAQLAYMKRMLFGRRSEKIDRNQLLLFNEIQKQLEDARAKEAEREAEAEDIRYTRRKGHGRKPLPEDLPRQRVEYPLEDTSCPDCGEPMRVIGEEVTDELDYHPGSYFVRQHVRPKYACRPCEKGVYIAELPPRPIDKGIPGPGLLAHVLTSKYADHLPLNRLQGIFRRHGIDIRVSTMCDWVACMTELLAPICSLLKEQLLAGRLISSDDTTAPYQVGEKKGKTATGYLWTYLSELSNIVLYDFTMTRSRAGPTKFLAGFEGYLVTDGYSGYAEMVRAGATSCGCWSHARRKFYDARFDDRKRCDPMIDLMDGLFTVERKAKKAELNRVDHLQLRQDESVSLLNRIRDCVDAWSQEVLPRSSVGQAVTYVRNQWKPLTRFLRAVDIPVHNNASERAMRHVVIGRKNWLFAGSVAGGHRAATIFSIVATCKASGIDPFAYLRDVIDRLPRGEDPLTLLPEAWKAAQLQSSDSPE